MSISSGNPLSASANNDETTAPFGGNDVLCSTVSERDNVPFSPVSGMALHPGNKRLMLLVAQRKPDYVAMLRDPELLPDKSPQEREALGALCLAKIIVEEIRSEHGGRFLIKDPNTGLWVVRGNPKAIDFTGNVIIDMTKDVREADPPRLSKLVIIIPSIILMVFVAWVIAFLGLGDNFLLVLGFLQLMICLNTICRPAPETTSTNTTERHPRQLPLGSSFELVSQAQPYSRNLPLEEMEDEYDDDDDDDELDHGLSLFDKLTKEDNECQREVQESDEMEIV